MDDCFTERAAEFYNNEDDEIPAGNPFQDLFDEMNGHDSDDNSDGASEYEDYPSSCVTAGSQSQFCIDEKDLSGFISTPVYHPKFDCFAKTSTCTIQSNKRCGWSETSALNDCLSNFEESEDQDEDPASAENDQSSCVIVGTQGEICMSKSEAEGKVFITQWLPENDCYKKSKAVCAAASASSSCTWQPSALLDSCLETFKDNSN